MKKSTIWILATIMAVAFFGLLYLQITYLRESIKMRGDQFNEAVNRSLSQISRNLDIDQTRKYLEEYENQKKKEAAYRRSLALSNQSQEETVTYKHIGKVTASDGSEINWESTSSQTIQKQPKQVFQSAGKDGTNAISKKFYDIQEEQKKSYDYEKDLVEEVYNMKLKSIRNVPIEDRVNFKDLEANIKSELKNNNVELAFQYEVVDKNDKSIYKQARFSEEDKENEYQQVLFPNDPAYHYLKVYFPKKNEFLFSEVHFLYPAILFTFILLVTFIIIIYITFRQKRLSEMKSDFMNNMTHELKTPVSTISLAAQMLKDGSITKSPDVFKHISGVINDETERLSIQVEKVVQMSLFEKQRATIKLNE